jgi:hypothetical protein
MLPAIRASVPISVVRRRRREQELLPDRELPVPLDLDVGPEPGIPPEDSEVKRPMAGEELERRAILAQHL